MKVLKRESVLFVYVALDRLPKDVVHLMEAAIKARGKAYAPYSKFQVGAAVLLSNNVVVTGNNQENASYPSGLCAERTAIYYAASQYPKENILKIAISAGSTKKQTSRPIPPCGACRQAISEYELKQKKPIEVYFMGATGAVAKSDSLSNLLPFTFDKSEL
ncbi:cytidine deaminase [Cognatitamlana onchidii]|uniref:cytidine deaminase n=1 Tax=Cognatitamlana onchidii TaxID=2562860 RepID=UPI0010A69A13|nr:cytidine deaminase [Algibacter onchidii]